VLGYDATPTPTAVELYKLLDAAGDEVTFTPFAMTVGGDGVFWGTLDGDVIPLAAEGETWSFIWETTIAGYADPIYDQQTLLVGFEDTPLMIITLTQAKAALNITDTTDDTLLTRLITECSALFAERWPLPTVPAVTETRTLPVDGRTVFLPFASAATAVTTVDDSPLSFTAIAGQRTTDPLLWLRLDHHHRGHVKVTGTFGLSAWPAYITGAVTKYVAVQYARTSTGGAGTENTYVGRFAAIPQESLDLMAPLTGMRA
jgi:hypothetical protein